MLDKNDVILYNILTYRIGRNMKYFMNEKEEYAMQKRDNIGSRGVRDKMYCCCCRNISDNNHKI